MSTATGSSLPKSGPPKNRLPIYLGAAAALGAGYYFYLAGGDAKVARKQAEHDASRASSALRSELPDREKEAKKSAEEYAARAGSAFDSTVEQGKQRIAQGSQQLHDAKDRAIGKIDETDRKIEDEASKAKSGVKSWFGGGKS